MCGAFSGFLSPIHSRHSVALFKFGFPPSQDSSLGPVTGLSWGKRKFWRTCDRVGDSRHVGFLELRFCPRQFTQLQ